MKLCRGKTVLIQPNRWEHLKYCLSENELGEVELTQSIVGSFEHFPLISAHAITVHKAQGDTIDKLMFVVDQGCFAEGQLYTALSRARSLSNLYMDREIETDDVKVNQQALLFERRIRNGST